MLQIDLNPAETQKPSYDKVALEKSIRLEVPQTIWDELDGIPAFLYGSRSMCLREKAIGSSTKIITAMNRLRSRGINKTDFDFIVQHSSALESELLKRKFKKIDGHAMYALDSSTTNVFTKEVHAGLGGKEEIQVILKRNLELVKKTWKAIDTDYYYKYLWKSSPDFAMLRLDNKGRKEYIRDQMNQLYRMYE